MIAASADLAIVAVSVAIIACAALRYCNASAATVGLVALQPPIFPIDQPVMPEGRQIGRRPAIDALERRVDGAVHQWLIGPRRIGKTSVAKAVLARLRTKNVVALDVDLSKLGLSIPEGLAGEIARQAQAARAGAQQGRRLLRLATRQASRAGTLGNALKDLGFDDEGEALAAVSSVLAAADDGAPGLASVLEALALQARATGRRVAILFDEVHLLARLKGSEGEISRWAREPDSPIVFVFAGSEEASVRALREPGRPLAAVGQEFHLADIATEDWLHGLRQRFREANVTIADAELFSIVEASDGHPRRTMLIATYVHEAAGAQPDRTATEVLVTLAISDAKADHAWT